MFWTCPSVGLFWAGVFEYINMRLALSIPVSPELALLRIHDDDQRPQDTKLLVSMLMFYAMKDILKNWSSPPPGLILGTPLLTQFYQCIN